MLTRHSAALPLAFVLLVAACTPGTQGEPSATTPPSAAPSMSASAGAAVHQLDTSCTEDNRCSMDAGTWITTSVTAEDDAFIPGLELTLPTAWSSREHWQSELEMDPVEPSSLGEVRMWIDMAPGGADGKADVTRQFDAAGMVDWITTNPNLVVSAPQSVPIAGLPAMVVDFTVSPTATDDDPMCPTGCATMLGRPGINCCIGYGQGEFVREYIFDVGPDAERHTMIIDLDSPFSAEALEQLDDLLRPILDSLVFPDEWVIWCGRTGPPHHDCTG
jgi:hypothetical protein